MRPHRGYRSGSQHQEREEGKRENVQEGLLCLAVVTQYLVGSLWGREPQTVAAVSCLITTSSYLIKDQQTQAEFLQGMQSWQALKAKNPLVWAIFKIIGYVKI